MTVAPTPHLRRAGLILIIASLAAIGVATLLPQAGAVPGSHLCLLCGSLGGVSAVLNILLFVPLGVGLALSGISARRAILVVCALSVLIELGQFLVIPGRNSTIGDVLTNTLGGAFGFALGRYSDLWIRPSPRLARNLTAAWVAVWLGIQIVSSYGFAVSLPDSRYYGQIARTLGNFAVFRGQVLNARIDRVQIPDSAFADSHRVRRLLLDGAEAAVTVIPGGPTPRTAPIVRIADEKRREILLLGQNGERLVFGIRTGAVVLRIRPPVFALNDAFLSKAAPPSDTVRLSGRYGGRYVTVGAQRGSTNNGRTLEVAASMGWSMWLPFQWLIEGTNSERAISLVWVFCLVIPLGYWSFRTLGSLRPISGKRVFLVAEGVLIWGGLVFVPAGFGLTTPVSDWIATLTGLALGAAISARTEEAHP